MKTLTASSSNVQHPKGLSCMRVVVTSDTCGLIRGLISSCDLFIHAGGLTSSGRWRELRSWGHYLSDRKDIRHSIIVPGSRDHAFNEPQQAARDLFSKRTYVLIDEAVTIGGVTFYGSPYGPAHSPGAFLVGDGPAFAEYQEARVQKKAPSLDVLITHSPPIGILDYGRTSRGDVGHLGLPAFRQLLHRFRPSTALFGKVRAHRGCSAMFEYTQCFNVACRDESGRIANPPLVLDLLPVAQEQALAS